MFDEKNIRRHTFKIKEWPFLTHDELNLVHNVGVWVKNELKNGCKY